MKSEDAKYVTLIEGQLADVASSVREATPEQRAALAKSAFRVVRGLLLSMKRLNSLKTNLESQE